MILQTFLTSFNSSLIKIPLKNQNLTSILKSQTQYSVQRSLLFQMNSMKISVKVFMQDLMNSINQRTKFKKYQSSLRIMLL